MGLLIWLIPLSVLMGSVGLTAFFWALRNGQFEDTEGDGQRLLISTFDQRPDTGVETGAESEAEEKGKI